MQRLRVHRTENIRNSVFFYKSAHIRLPSRKPSPPSHVAITLKHCLALIVIRNATDHTVTVRSRPLCGLTQPWIWSKLIWRVKVNEIQFSYFLSDWSRVACLQTRGMAVEEILRDSTHKKCFTDRTEKKSIASTKVNYSKLRYKIFILEKIKYQDVRIV